MTATPDARAPAAASGGAPLPRHVAIIMDGNGRWAKARGLNRTDGHRRGVDTVRRVVRRAGELGIGYLTLFSFSSENWSRPADEVSTLMMLLRFFIRSDLADLKARNVRVRIIGSREGVPRDIAALLDEAEMTTAGNTGLTLVVAFNYGARQEIARAARELARRVAAGQLSAEAVTPELLATVLDTVGIPDPDLIIRTSGEQRLSNFLLWQAAYAEFVFVPLMWPDFDERAFEDAIATFGGRDRRFGGLSAGER
ncbi:MAG: isoprenyl transferase [Hyphomicrobiaceae bacterium]|nr:isoprenyl transferase [Hyphomicrobiaceae bacterium]